MNSFDVLDIYFKDHKYPFTGHHIDSFRKLIKTYIPEIIKSYNPITMIKYDDLNNIKMKTDVYIGGKHGTEIFIDRPITYEDGDAKLITPNDTRLKNLTYESNMYANILVEITDVDNNIITKTFKRVAFGSIPIMLHSDICMLNSQGSDVLRKLGECIYDTGGYFIIDGKEKVIISQERITTNRLFISVLKDDDKYSHKAIIRCTAESGENMLSPKTIQFMVVKNNQDMETNMKSMGSIVVSLPSINANIPLVLFFRALGIESDKDIYETIFGIDNSEV